MLSAKASRSVMQWRSVIVSGEGNAQTFKGECLEPSQYQFFARFHAIVMLQYEGIGCFSRAV